MVSKVDMYRVQCLFLGLQNCKIGGLSFRRLLDRHILWELCYRPPRRHSQSTRRIPCTHCILNCIPTEETHEARVP